MRSEKEIREELEQINADLEKLYDMYDNDEITTDGYQKSHKTLSCIQHQLKWVLGKE